VLEGDPIVGFTNVNDIRLRFQQGNFFLLLNNGISDDCGPFWLLLQQWAGGDLPVRAGSRQWYQFSQEKIPFCH
jgi:hypothetical protein